MDRQFFGVTSTCCGGYHEEPAHGRCVRRGGILLQGGTVSVILAPKNADFITYRLLYSLSGLVTEDGTPDFLVKLINTGLAEQFIIHMKTALCAGILCASYSLYQLFRFVSPALYVN